MDTVVSPPVAPSTPLAITTHPADTSASARAWRAAAAAQLLAPASGLLLAALVVLGTVPPAGGLVAVVVVAVAGVKVARSFRAAAWRRLEEAVATAPSNRVRVADLSRKPLNPRAELACTAVLLAAVAAIAWEVL